MKTIIRFFAVLVILQSITFSQGWSTLNTGVTRNLTYIDFLDQNTGFAGPSLIRTTDGGITWTQIPGTSNFNKVCFLDINNGYATDGSSSGPGSLYKTTNGGINWTIVSADFICQMYFLNTDTGYFVNNSDFNLSDFLGTTNGGQIWNALHNDIFNPFNLSGISFYNLQFLNSNEGYLNAATYVNNLFSASYVLRTTNGGVDWGVNLQSTSLIYKDFSFPSINNGFVIDAGNPNSGKIFDYSGNLLFTYNHAFNSVNSINASNAFAVGTAGTIVKTTNSGLNWNVQNAYVSVQLNAVKFVNSNTGYIVGDNGTILKTYTGGDTSFNVSGQIRFQDNNQPVNSGYVKALKYDSLSKQVLTLDSAAIQPNGAYTMSHVAGGISFDIMAFENDESQLNFVPTYYPSTVSWQNATALTLTSNLTGIDVLVYRINNTGGPYHIAGTINGLFQNMMNLKGSVAYAKIGSNYQAYSISNSAGYYRIDSLSSGTYTVVIDRMGFFPVNRQVVITNFSKDTINITMDNGTLLGTTQEGNPIPSQYSLGTNYPNPFNPSTKFSFGIPKDSRVRLTIHDMLGREVVVLVSEELKAGNYSVNWNASSFASGVYFYRIESGDFIQTKKMVLIK